MVSLKSILALALLPLLSTAITITSPTNGTLATKGTDLTVSWTSVDTDPTTFGILLVNFVYFPPSYVQLAFDVPTSQNSTTVHVPCDTIATDGYQINAINGTNTYVIYAQSGKFAVAGEDCVDPTPLPTCPAPVTVTATATVAPTKKPWGPPKKEHKHGKVPKTIGWHGKGYDYPVTLDVIPTDAPKPLKRYNRAA